VKPLVPHTADEILQLGKVELKELRSHLAAVIRPHMKSLAAAESYLKFMELLSMVQDMQAWRDLAEPGIAPKLFDLGEEFHAEIEPARELDRLSVDAHEQSAKRFEEAGGRRAFQEAIESLNGLV